MNKWLGLAWLASVLFAQTAFSADAEPATRAKKIRDTSAWLTNSFVPWLTNEFPEVTIKPYPEWFVNPFSKTRLPTWLTNTFPHIDTEVYPHWLEEPEEEMLAKGIPDWWGDAVKRIPTVPPARTLPAIVRGPYLQLATTNSMVVRWRTDVPTPGIVNFGLTPGKLSKQAKASGTLTEHIVLLTNLQPDTKYFYSIGTRDTPMIVRLTNNIALVSTTNATLYVSSRGTNIVIAAVTNGTLVFSVKRGKLSLASPDETFSRDTTNTLFLVSTVNELLYLAASNGVLSVTTPDQIIPLDGGDTGKKPKKPTRYFAVGSVGSPGTELEFAL